MHNVDGARLAHFQARVLADCLSEATADYWERRAREFEAAAPQPGDFNGRATPEDLEARRRRCLSTAAACRARAAVEGPGLTVPPIIWAELWRAAA